MKSILLLIPILLAATPARAARVFFSLAGSPDQTICRPTVGEVPGLVLFPHDRASYFLWLTPDEVWDPAEPNSRQEFRSVSFDVEMRHFDAFTISSFQMANPLNAAASSPRWDSVSNGFPATSMPFAVQNTVGIANTAPGIGNTTLDHFPYDSDQGYDPVSRSFFLGRIDFVGGFPTTLYLRTGETGNFLSDGSPAPIQFGNDTLRYFDDPQNPGGQGDPITDDRRHADAWIAVTLAPTMYKFVATSRCRSDLFFYDPDLSEQRFRSVPQSEQFLLFVENLSAAERRNLTLYVDLTADETADKLIAHLQNSDYVLSATRSDFVAQNGDVPGLTKADVAIGLNLENLPEGDRFLEVRFPPVDALLLVPEPQSLTYGLCAGLFVALGTRRHRAARLKDMHRAK
jgi:hypothetical protein